ncbi:VanZ family protein [Nostoc ellipsosporum NOK]|nr:VanZ family protein [Nostoc ellipsosporum NOK]
MTKQRIVWTTLAVLWFIICTVLLCLPGSAFPESSWLDNIPFFDKWVHVGLFAVMTFLFCRAAMAWGREATKTFITLSLISFAFGVLMEFVQHYWIPYRSFDVWDMVADGVGAAVGFLAIRLFLKGHKV